VKVADVVNRYVSIALESSIEDRRDQSDSTLSFFQQEVQRLSQELDLQSGKIVTFKDENGDALPENLEYRQNRESLLQERVSRGERELERTQPRRTTPTNLERRAERRPEHLVRNQPPRAQPTGASGRADRNEPPISAQETALDISLAEIDSRTNALQQEIKEANAELESLRVSIERTPANGILLAGMEREQENIQNLYKR